MGYQLYAMGLTDSNRMDPDAEMINVLLEIYERMGDCLAMQYGGSEMHRSMKKDRDKTQTMGPVLYRSKTSVSKSKEVYVSIMRHYSNTFQDKERQDAMNLFLGRFTPSRSFSDEPLYVLLPDPSFKHQNEEEKGLLSRLWNIVNGTLK